MTDFQRDVSEILEEVQSEDDAKDAAERLAKLYGRATSLGKRWQALQSSRKQGDERDFKDAMESWSEGLKYNAAIEGACGRLRQQPEIWKHLFPVMRDLGQALRPGDDGYWVAVREPEE